MSQTIDPSYNARMNTEKEKFGVVFHAPELPAPSSVYANYVCFLSTDGCFYECHLDGEDYVWEKQTFGPKRQFIISVTWLVQGADGFSFNDEVDTIKQIVTEMKKYDTYFTTLESEYPALTANNMTLIEACSITDKLIDYVNKYCVAGLSHVDIDTDSPSASEYVDPPAATCEQLATYLNEVIGVLNPHAGFSVLTKEVEALREIISGNTPEGVSVVTPTDFNMLRNTFNQFTSNQQVANRKFSEDITNIRSSITTINNTIGGSGLSGTVDKIITKYLGINQSQWTDETKSIITRINEINTSLTDATIDGTIAKKIKTLSDVVSGPSGTGGLAKDVADLKAAVTANGTGLKDVVGDQTKGLVKKVTEMSTAVEDLKAHIGTAKIQSIDDRLALARTAFIEMSQIMSNTSRVYSSTSDEEPVPGKRYWMRSVEYVDVVNPDLNDGNEYYIESEGLMERVTEDPTLPGVDFHCKLAKYTYTIDRSVHTEGFKRGIEYYEINMSQDDLVDTVWSIIEKASDVATALELTSTEESENEGD